MLSCTGGAPQPARQSKINEMICVLETSVDDDQNQKMPFRRILIVKRQRGVTGFLEKKNKKGLKDGRDIEW